MGETVATIVSLTRKHIFTCGNTPDKILIYWPTFTLSSYSTWPPGQILMSFYYHWPVFFENIQVMLHMWRNWSHTTNGLIYNKLDENQSVGAFNVTCLKGVIIGLGNGMWSSGVEAISNINVESSSHHGRYQRENGCAYNYVLWITILFRIDCINNITHALWWI